MSDPVGTFGTIDYVVFSCMLGISVAIGIYHAFAGGKQKTTKEFLLANGDMNPIPVAMSLVASFISAITVLGTPAEMYVYGGMYWLYAISFIFAGIFGARFIIPVIFRLNLTSANQYLEMRFNKTARICGLLAFMVQMFIYMGIVIYAPALALNAVTGINLWGSVLATGLACTIYTSIGGMKAVLWTDVFQMVIMLSGFLAVIIEGCRRIGGIDVMWKICEENGRLDFWDFNPDPTIRHTFWTIVIGGAFNWGYTYGVNQAQVQRYLSTGSPKRAQISLFLAIIGMAVVVSLACLSGLTMYAFYVDCDPLALGNVKETDQLIAYFTLELFGKFPGLPGLFTSAVFSGALSSVSSGLNALSAVTTEDFVKSVWKNWTEERMAWISKGVALAYGLFAIVMAYVISLMSGSVLQYLERRFNRTVRIFGMLTLQLMMIFYMGIVIYGPALALNQVTGINLWGAVIAIGVVCTFYTTIGGMKAVLWTDVFQVCIMFAGFLAVIIEGNRRLGGMKNMWKICEEGGRIDFWDFRVDPTIRHTFWSLVIGGTFTWTAVYGVNQAQVQRYLTCATENTAKLALFLAIIGMLIVVSVACLSGLTMYAYYADCDPYTMGYVTSTDQLIPYFVLDLFQHLPGIPGLFVSAVFSAALSTISSGLNALAAVLVEDVIKAIWKDLGDSKYAIISKVVACSYGVVVIFVAYIASIVSTSILQIALSIFGMTGGPLLGLFCLGMFFPWTNAKGAITGLLVGLTFIFWIGIGAILWPPYVDKPPLSIDGCGLNFTTTMPMTSEAIHITTPPPINKLYTISYAWYACVAWCTTVFFGLLVSFLTGATKPRDVDEELFISIVDTMYCCFPESCKSYFRCGFPKKVGGKTFNEVDEDLEVLKMKVVSDDSYDDSNLDIPPPAYTNDAVDNIEIGKYMNQNSS
ncbi:uncharacterized protein [Amphiura filiformis]|uniref:uncharacterized protein n=1 Tax=Amphiura filiformis TaxID=82378 RepID=UPI003B2111F2